MSNDRSGVLAWALGTFHACAVGLLLVLLLYPGGGLGALIGGLETVTGLLIFIALWATSVWTTSHALAGGAWLSAEPGPRSVFFGQALRWGAATGMLFLAELGAIFLVRTLIVAPRALEPLGVLAFGAFAGTIGMIFAFVIGGVVGVTLGALDLAALSLARASNREYVAQETEAEREARYFAGYAAIPDGNDEDVRATEQAAIEDLKEIR